MSKRHSRTRNKKQKIDPAILERIENQLIFKKQLEIANKVLNRLTLSSQDAGFVNAEQLFLGWAVNFERLYLGFDQAIDNKLEALSDLAKISNEQLNEITNN